MKNKKVLIGAAIIIFIILCAIFSGDTTDKTNNEIQNQIEVKNEIEENVEYIYKEDELINKFLNKYNELYSEEPISAEMISVYHHHGTDHKDQIQFTLKGLQITLTDEIQSSKKVSVFIQNKSNSKNDKVLKELTKKFVKLYNQELTNQQIEDSLNKQTSIDNIEFQISKAIDNDVIEYIKIIGIIE